MARAGVGLLVVALLFGAGFATGRLTAPSSDDERDAGADTAALVAGAREMPIELGGMAPVGSWEVLVQRVRFDAVDDVLRANQFNVEPPEGSTYMVLDISLTRHGVGPAIVQGSLAPALVTPGDVVFPLNSACGVLARPLDTQQLLAPEDTVEGEWCWVIPEIEISKVNLRISATGGGEVWFALR